jgi:hypothetical protein
VAAARVTAIIEQLRADNGLPAIAAFVACGVCRRSQVFKIVLDGWAILRNAKAPDRVRGFGMAC